jgi:hypothetical protein
MNKEQNSIYAKIWQASNKEHIKEYRKFYNKKYRKELRQQVIELYSHGTCKCSHCGGSVEELHHTNPEDGKWEMQEFGIQTNIQARKHQLEMYTVIPDYITPLCKKCHLKLHKELGRYNTKSNGQDDVRYK